MKYRAEIDGLRAIAVLSVILYHAKIDINLLNKDWFVGGYVGVDIFFVISGYLITSIILNELYKNSSFNFSNFYTRRARRILPMLFFVILISFPFAWNKLIFTDLIEYAKSVISTILFGSNFFFYFINSAYDAADSSLKPFLHTWSLGIEEQFYLIFPIILLGLYNFFKKQLFIIILIFFFISLAFASLANGINKDLNFFNPLSRFWELLSGSILAYLELNYGKTKNKYVKNFAPIIGSVLIGYSILFFNNQTSHPSYVTLIPIVGTIMIIAFSSSDDFVGKILGSKPFIGVGLISYSAYLWHFPIMAFGRIDTIKPDNLEKIKWIILTFLVSIVSYFLIEKVFRNKKIIKTSFFYSIIFLFAVIILSFSSLISFSDKFSKFWTGNAPKHLIFTQGISNDVDYNIYEKMYDNNSCIFWGHHRFGFDKLTEFKKKLNVCESKIGKKIIIIGDSHAMNLFNIIGRSDYSKFVFGYSIGGCQIGLSRKCKLYKHFEENFLDFIKKGDIIIFHQSGSQIISDKNGNVDSNLAFNQNNFYFKKKDINLIKNYLNELSIKTKAKVFWIGPFVEYRREFRDITLRIKNEKSYIDLLTINPNSIEIFDKLEKYLIKNNENQLFSYISFNEILKVENSAYLNLENDLSCFQFKNRDHISECGEKYYSSKIKLDKLEK